MTNFEKLNKSFINGEWVEGKSERTYTIQDPYDQSSIATVRLATVAQVDEAFKAAEQAQKEWGKASVRKRQDVIMKALEYIRQNREDIVQIIVRETGGTLFKANMEVEIALEELQEAAHMADELGKTKVIQSSIPGKENYVHRLPLGVISSITPFNFPLNLGTRTIGPAIALGNAVVHKPDIQVGIVGGQIFAKAFEYAGLPKGVFNSILTDPQEIGDIMFNHPIPRLVSFTGSTAVGRHIGKVAGEHLKRVALELGGNSPLVILSDADVDRAVDAAIFGKFVHNGQICMISNRIIVQRDCYDEFVKKFVARAKELPVGDPKDSATVIGPVINERQADKVMTYIEKAKAEGLHLALEGKREGNVISPFVFIDVPNDSTLAQTELFGPVAQIIPVESDEEAIRLANETDYGLSSAIFTEDIEKGHRLALEIDSGMTHINDQTVNAQANVAFGGTKGSGVGRFGNPWIVDEFTVTKWVSLQNQHREYPF